MGSNVFQKCWTSGGQMVHEARYAVNRGCGESTRQLLSLEWECISLQLANENSSSKETVSHGDCQVLYLLSLACLSKSIKWTSENR